MSIELEDYIILDLTEILSELYTTQDGTFLLIDRESAEGLAEMIQQQLAEKEQSVNICPDL